MDPSCRRVALVLSVVLASCTVAAAGVSSAPKHPQGQQRAVQSVTWGADVKPPTAPPNVQADLVGHRRVRITWDAASDNVRVTGYDIVRNGHRIASIGARTIYRDRALQLSRRYVYRLHAHDHAGNLSSLSNKAAATTPDPLIAAAGDIACDPDHANFNGGEGTESWCRQRATSNLLLGRGYDRILTLGDNQYESGTLAAYRASYDPSWGRIKRITSPAVGNHEYRTRGAAGYFNYFGAAAGDSAKGYYSYNLGQWHIIALNSECHRLHAGSAIDGCAEGSPQNNWLEADLAAHPARCTLAYWHRPPSFSSAGQGDSSRVAALWRDVYAADADVILTGHRHTYSRFTKLDDSGRIAASGGMRLFVVGTGGKNHGEAPSVTPPTVERRNDTTFGVLQLALHSAAYEWRFVGEAGSSFSDSGSTACH